MAVGDQGEGKGDPAAQPATAAGSGQPATGPDDERAQLEQLNRKLSTRTYAGGAALVLALAAAIVAIVLAVDARDNSASQSEVNRLEQQLAAVAEQAGASEEAQEGVESLGGQIDSLEDEVSGFTSTDREIQERLDVIEDDIEDLRQQISDLDSGGGSSNDGGSGNNG